MLIIFHILICLALVMIVLLQTGKGADMGATFGGGSSQTLFGSTGASTFLTKSTTLVAVAFMLTSLWSGLYFDHQDRHFNYEEGNAWKRRRFPLGKLRFPFQSTKSPPLRIRSNPPRRVGRTTPSRSSIAYGNAEVVELVDTLS